MADKQLSFDLGDKLQKYEKIAKDMVAENKYCNSISVRIFSSSKEDVYWLGTRTFFYETEYTHDHKIDWETAKYLYQTVDGVSDFCGSVSERIIKENEEQNQKICPKCGCVKESKSELIGHHKSSC